MFIRYVDRDICYIPSVAHPSIFSIAISNALVRARLDMILGLVLGFTKEDGWDHQRKFGVVGVRDPLLEGDPDEVSREDAVRPCRLITNRFSRPR